MDHPAPVTYRAGAGTPVVDDCQLTLPAAFWLPTGDRGIPSGSPAPVEGTTYDFRKPRPIGATRLDQSLTGLDRDRAGPGRTWPPMPARGPRSVCEPARATGGCRFSPATR
jgi:hypothetical protein